MATLTALDFPGLRTFQTAEQMELLNVVDSLRAHGLGELTELPQLIVCGDQSSGKSSVLEAISGIQFPKQDGLCTRFATEVILRRGQKENISVSIVPADDRTPTDKTRLRQFQHHLVTRDGFPNLFEEVKGAMGLSGQKSFSRDVLRVEFCGPTQPQLTLVDLPGLIHSEAESQNDGIRLVADLVTKYITNRRGVILAIISAKNDASNQVILNRAREVDPHGVRTLGIITKPDTLIENSHSEKAFLDLARNQVVKFQLGWHVVMNLDSAEASSTQGNRDEQESLYFKNSNFRNLPSHSIGISSLRTRLSKILFNQIRIELPRVVKDIEDRINVTIAEQDKLGPSRVNIDEQRQFLIGLSQSFQNICRDAIKGDYDHAFFQSDPKPEKRLCSTLMNKHFRFAEDLRSKGSLWSIKDEKMFESNSRTREEAILEASKLLKSSRGRELPGLPNPLLVGELFREYSRPWGSLARQHIKDVWDTTNNFILLALQQLTDVDVSDQLFRLFLYPIMEQRLKTAYDKLDELLEVHKEPPMTANLNFADNRKRFQQKNNNREIEKRLKSEFKQPGQKFTVNDISRFLEMMTLEACPDMDLVAAEDAFDDMMAYYKASHTVAMRLFMDNVPTLVIRASIIRKLPEMFCPTAVFNMKSELVAKIAGEAEEKALERAEILRRLKMLEDGARICKQYSMRPQSLFPPGEVETESLQNTPTPLSFSQRLLKSQQLSVGTTGPIALPPSGSNPKGSLFGTLTKDQTASIKFSSLPRTYPSQLFPSSTALNVGSHSPSLTKFTAIEFPNKPDGSSPPLDAGKHLFDTLNMPNLPPADMPKTPKSEDRLSSSVGEFKGFTFEPSKDLFGNPETVAKKAASAPK